MRRLCVDTGLLLLGFLDKPLPAFGAGDGNFAFTARDTNHLTAPGTLENPVFAVFETIKKQQKSVVFLISFVDIPGEGSENSPDHTAVADEGQRQGYIGIPYKHGDNGTNQTGSQNRHIQLISTVAPSHETPQPLSKSRHKITRK
jgi:hypothetical protein